MHTTHTLYFGLLKIRLIGFDLAVTTLLLCFVAPSAPASVGQAARNIQTGAPQERRVVARSHLTGTSELQQIVTWHTTLNSGSGRKTIGHLAIETIGSKPRTLWDADDRFPAIEVRSVRATDLDGDGLVEIVGLWWQGASAGARLRVFHYDRNIQTFVELQPKGNDESAGMTNIHRYRVLARTARQRIIVYRRAPAGRRTVPGGEFEVRGSEIVRVRGGATMTAPSKSGIEGQAVISPVHPGPVREGQQDAAAYKTTLVVWSVSEAREVARLETGSDGRFRVALPPGTYRIGPPVRIGRFFPRGIEQVVTVTAGRFAHVTINFDSGMR